MTHSYQVILRNASGGYGNRNWYKQVAVELRIVFTTTRSRLLVIRCIGIVVGGVHGGTEVAVDNLNCLDEGHLIYT
jgi:hypothetical protein